MNLAGCDWLRGGLFGRRRPTAAASREIAPGCPVCGAAVTTRSPSKCSHLDVVCWNTDWDHRCEACGHRFQARVSIATGHPAFGSGARSDIEISGSDSLNHLYDYWHHHPAITVKIRRAAGQTNGSGEGGLDAAETFTVTAEEFLAIARELHGPLKVLLARRPWSRDTT